MDNLNKKMENLSARPKHLISTPKGDFEATDVNFSFGTRKPIDEADFKKFMAKVKKNQAAYCPSIKDYYFNKRRYKNINGMPVDGSNLKFRGISFWMFRDQRVEDNWAMVLAQKLALQHECPLYVTFWLMSHYSVAGIRQYDFLLRGLQVVEKQCQELGIQFHLELGYAKDLIVDYCDKHEVDLVIADFCPLRDPLGWVKDAGERLKTKKIPLLQVDAHNIVPTWIVSDQAEWNASKIRPKVFSNFKEFMTEIPALEKHPYKPKIDSHPADFDSAWKYLRVDETVKPITWAQPGPIGGYRMLYEFITQRLERYAEDRNNPTIDGCSNLSPWLHFGQLSVQRAVLCVTDLELKEKYPQSVESFVEEAVIRAALGDNFCYYQPNYDNLEGAWRWAKETIAKHRKDKREHIYSKKQLQFGETHDKCWNAAQIQMLQEGKMHGYLRMYWAKKILEWTPNVEEALKIAMFLNDKYSMDGRDPNGYTGIMWSIVGATDRAFDERPVVGKIRYMTYGGCARKFDVNFLARTYSKAPKPRDSAERAARHPQ